MELATLLGAMAGRGETAAEIAGFAQALRAARHAPPAHRRRSAPPSSTPAAPAATSAAPSTSPPPPPSSPPPRASRSSSTATAPSPRRSGSADVLEALGVPIDLAPRPPQLPSASTASPFCRAQPHPAMKAVCPPARALGVRTIFNLARPAHQPRRRLPPGPGRLRRPSGNSRRAGHGAAGSPTALLFMVIRTG